MHPYLRAALACAAATLPVVTTLPAQTEPRPHRLGVFFWHESPNDEATYEGIRAGLAVSKVPHTLTVCRANADPARQEQAFAELRTADCELIFAMGTEAALRTSAAFPDRPVVFAAVTNPVASGVVDGWEGSGRNLAGGSNWIPPATVLHVFRLAVPDLRRLGMLRSSPPVVVSAAELATMRDYLRQPGAPAVQVVDAAAAGPDDIARAVQELLAADVQAIWIPIDIGIYKHLDRVRAALAASKVPLVATAVNGPQQGAVVGATIDFGLHGRRVAALAVDVLLQRRDPARIAVDTMHSYLVVANLAAGRRCGHQLPLSLLAIADVLIDQEGADASQR